jgi:hypothetical protein
VAAKPRKYSPELRAEVVKALVWAVLDRASRGWRGLTLTPAGLRLLQDLRRSLLEPPRQLRPHTAAASQPGDAVRECRHRRLTSPRNRKRGLLVDFTGARR